MKKATFIILALVLITTGFLAQAQVLSSCGQWASYSSGGYTVYNNIWGGVDGSQCITATSTTVWSVVSTQPATSGVKSYPNSSREPLGVSLGSISALTSSMNVTVPSSGDFNAAWDIWAPTEVMIWIYKSGAVAPWGSFVETASIGGTTWDVYKNGYPGFLMQNNVTSATVNVKAILDYCVTKGWLASSNKLINVQGGFEISSTNGVASTFKMNSYSVSITTSEPLEAAPVQAPASETPVVGGTYKILNAKSSKVMDVLDGSTADSATVQIWDYDGGANQQWTLLDAGSSGVGYYKLINVNSGKALQVDGWSTADGGMITQATFADYQNNQMWTLVKEGNYYEIVNRNSGKLADVVSAGTFNGTKLHQWAYYSTDALSQRWCFVAVGSTPTDPPSVTDVPTTPPTVTDAPTTPPTVTDFPVTIEPTTPPSVTAGPTDTPAPTAIPTATPAGVTAAPTDQIDNGTAVPTAPPTVTDVPATGCTCTNLCTSQTTITVPFTKDGSGEYCYVSTALGSYVNSWNTDAVNINGTNCTNTYVSSSSIAAIGGYYYIYYKGSFGWSHLEIK